jgi:catalase
MDIATDPAHHPLPPPVSAIHPERSTRGATAHGTFRVYESMESVTEARFLHDPAVRTKVFVRFAMSPAGLDPVRVPRTSAVKLYTVDGMFDLLSQNVPVATTVGPENEQSLEALLWLLSDRVLLRSYRTMPAFGMHTCRLVNAAGDSRFVRFHWHPMAGTRFVGIDEATKVAERDPDFLRRDLWESIEQGRGPEYELGVQFLEEDVAQIRPVGRLVLDRNPETLFSDTTPGAFHTGHVVPGIDVVDEDVAETTDPLGDAARFYRSLSESERRHLAAALRERLESVDDALVLSRVDPELWDRVAGTHRGRAVPVPSASVPSASSAEDVRSSRVAILAADGVNSESLGAIRDALLERGAVVKIVAKRIGILTGADGRERLIDHSWLTTSAATFDAVYVPGGAQSAAALRRDPDALEFLDEAYRHGKAIAATDEGATLVQGRDDRPGVIAGPVSDALTVAFLEAIAAHRHWNR